MIERRDQNDDNFEGDENVVDGLDDAIEAVEDELGDNDTQIDELEKIREKARDGSDKCRNNINKVQQGVLCLLASGIASKHATYALNIITVKVNETSTGETLKSCSEVFNAMCLLETGEAPQDDVVLEDDAFESDPEGTKEGCKKLKDGNLKALI